MKTILKKASAAVMALAVMASAVVFDVPGKMTAEAAAPAAGGCDGEAAHLDMTALNTLSASASGYLSGDVNVSSETEITGNVTICLNGHTIKSSGSRIFTVKDGGSLTICDCKGTGIITGGNLTSEDGGAVYVESGGTFTINGGTISGNIVSGSGDGGAVFSKGTFTMNGGTISGNTARNGGGVDVNSGAFTMNGGTILNNNVKSDPNGESGSAGGTGGGVFLYKGGTFNMSGGEIKGNTAVSSGGGVYVHEGSIEFVMDGGAISGNTADYQGGGVYVCSANGSDPCGVFKMNGGTISGNTAKANKKDDNGGGGGVYTAGEFTMSRESIITGNTADNKDNPEKLQYGGGVCVSSGGKFTMESGTISGNTSKYGGGIHMVNGTFNMTKGSIGANEASGCGGGVYLSGGEFTMESGTISDNTAPNGGGIYVGSNNNKTTFGVFEMTGGTVSNNTAEKNGGGVYMDNGHGGEIMTLDGTVNITSNKKADGSASNVYLRSGKTITIGSSFLTADEIGVHTEDVPDCTDYVAATVFASGVTATEISGYFKADITGQGIVNDKNSNVQLTGDHNYGTEWSKDNTDHWHECIKCGYQNDNEAHIWDSGKVTTPPTCTEPGVKTYTCIECEHTKTEEIPAMGHDYGDWIITKEPTLTAEGIATRICANDSSHTETKTLPKLSSTPDNNNDSEDSSSTDNSDDTGSDIGNVTHNPPTGIVISFIPLAAAISVITVTVKRNKK